MSVTPASVRKLIIMSLVNTTPGGVNIKPLNVSETVFSNTTGCSVSELVKPATVSKPVLSNNVCNECP